MDRLLFIQGRNLGDSVISTGLINSLGKSFPELHVDVFTRPQYSAIFYNNPNIRDIYYANFPMGTQKNFNFSETIKFFLKIKQLRKIEYDTCINTMGDFRENTIGWLINPRWNTTVIWEGAHPFNMFIRKGCYSLTNNFVQIPENIINIYDANVLIAKELGCKFIEKPKLFLNNNSKKNSCKKNIAIHPLASQKSKLWDFGKWKSLINFLKESEYVWIFGAPGERKELETIFKPIIDNKRIVVHTGTLEEFFSKLSDVRLLIGLDSFSVHAAYALNIPSVMLIGSNDYRIWQSPNSRIVSKGNVCNYYPCYNKPKCTGKDFEYICMKAIKIEDVQKAIQEVL